MDTKDTIVAIASPPFPAVRGIVRVSGDNAIGLLVKLGLLNDGASWGGPVRLNRKLQLGSPIDEVDVDVLVWPNERSYTGQPAAELHLTGCLPIVRAVVDACIDAGARAAKPGEFTLRAFLAGRLDLTQAEAVLGVIEAEDRNTLRQALSQLAGNLSSQFESARDLLLDLLADVEAGLDFVDEDISFISDSDLIERLQRVAEILRTAMAQIETRDASRAACNVVFRGPPNAGKSSLFNALVGDDRAIVSDQPGTTRDLVMADVTWDGHPIRLIDTAGIEDPADDAIMIDAQNLAGCVSKDADLRIWCSESSPTIGRTRGSDKRSAVDLCVQTKADLSQDAGVAIRVSSATGQGIEALRERILQVASSWDDNEIGGVLGTAARCREALRAAERSLQEAIALTRLRSGHELIAGEMRLVIQALGEVTGEVVTDDILDRIFSRFCIGK